MYMIQPLFFLYMLLAFCVTLPYVTFVVLHNTWYI